MWRDVQAAAAAGVLVGVKAGVALLIIAACLALAAGDYASVRVAARNGQAAFNTLQQLAEQQQKAQAAK